MDPTSSTRRSKSAKLESSDQTLKVARSDRPSLVLSASTAAPGSQSHVTPAVRMHRD
jgi:hypothetical protein